MISRYIFIGLLLWASANLSAAEELKLLGMTLGEIPADSPGYESVDGVYVVAVEPSGIAEQAGIRAGDVIIAVSPSSTASIEELVEIVESRAEKGRLLMFSLVRPAGRSESTFQRMIRVP